MNPRDLKIGHWYWNDFFLRQKRNSLQVELEITGLLRYGGPRDISGWYYKFFTFHGHSFDLCTDSVRAELSPISNVTFEFFKLFLGQQVEVRIE